MQELTLAVIYAEQLEQRAQLDRLETMLVERLDRLEAMLAELLQRGAPAPQERADDLITVDEIAALFKCAHSSVLTGKAGTAGIHFIGKRPKTARRGEVMRVYRAYIASPRPSQARKIKLLNRKPRS